MNSMSGEKLKGIPYTGTLPAVLAGTKAGYLHKYKMYGNATQSGTPTPENPIVPQECGERTENLFDLNRLPSDTWTTDTRYYLNGGIANSKAVNPSAVTISVNNDTLSVTTNAGNGAGFLVEVTPSTEYRLAFTKSKSISSNKASCTYAFVDTSETIGQLQAIYGDDDAVVFTTDSNTKYVYFVFRVTSGTISYSNIMLNIGSTPLPYEPYGYKLPLTSGSTPVDIYLGESQTTRRIKKLVLTGEENWLRQSPSHTTCINLYIAISNAKSNGVIMSNVITHNDSAGAYNDSLVNVGRINGAGTNLLMDMDLSEFATLTAWQTYLAQQYANGTPVTIWYVLATEETGTLNEPLRKIGDYADTIDSTQTTAQIPTTANSTTISWGGQGLAPSEFDSIQEWVDIPTYKRVNGAWVEDN